MLLPRNNFNQSLIQKVAAILLARVD